MMKYLRHRKFGFLLFESSLSHQDVARWIGGPGEILSAGFVFGPEGRPSCGGFSTTLNLGAAANDTFDLRNRMFGGG